MRERLFLEVGEGGWVSSAADSLAWETALDNDLCRSEAECEGGMGRDHKSEENFPSSSNAVS